MMVYNFSRPVSRRPENFNLVFIIIQIMIVVATGFPTGQYDLTSRLQEIRHSVLQGATEIDVVINRSLVLNGQWDLLYQELQQMKVCSILNRSHIK